MTHTPTIGGMFAVDTKDHQLTILLDQGAHKHLRAHAVDQDGRPHGMYSVDLITWPGRVAVSGDMDGFTFRGAPDMLPLLRTATQDGDISWGYLAEKVDAGRGNITGFSQEAFRRHVHKHVTEDIRDRTAPRGIGRAVYHQLLGGDFGPPTSEEEARINLRDFSYGDYEFCDTDEWDLTSYTSDFERAVLGIQLVIRLYDQANAAGQESTPTAA